MNIGEAAAAAGISAKMVRHYERIGLIPEAARTDSGYRQYSMQEVSVLRFIWQSRRLGFSMKQIAELIGLWGNSHRTSREVKSLASAHLADLEDKLRELGAMKDALERLVDSCHGDDDPECAIIGGLSSDSPVPPSPEPAWKGTSDEPAGKRQSLMGWTQNLS